MKYQRFIKSYLIFFLLAVIFTTACSSNSSPDVQMETTAAATDSPGNSLEPESTVLPGTSISPIQISTQRKLIRTINMSLETTEFDQLIQIITQKVSESGGYIEQSDISGNSIQDSGDDTKRFAAIIARVPNESVDAFVSNVQQNGNILSKSESASDVTLQYADIESRKKTLAVEQERIWTLLEKTESLDSMIMLEQRLTEIRYELESYESQLRLYDNQVAFSTVSLTIDEVLSFTPAEKESAGTRMQNGFTKNLNGFLNIIVNLSVWIIAGIPIFLPLLAIGAAVFLIQRRRARKTDQIKKQNISKHTDEPMDTDGNL